MCVLSSLSIPGKLLEVQNRNSGPILDLWTDGSRISTLARPLRASYGHEGLRSILEEELGVFQVGC